MTGLLLVTRQDIQTWVQACTHCLDDTDNIWLTHCKKIVYMGHRRFLPIRHAVRKKGKHFKGQADQRTKPMHRSGKDVFNVVKDLEVIFGKGSGSQPVPNENGMAPKEIYILGATILESLRCSSCNRCDAPHEEFLRQPDSILGSVRKDKRYSRSTSRIATYGRTRYLTSTTAR